MVLIYINKEPALKVLYKLRWVQV